MVFDNSYTRLPDEFYQRINPVPVSSPGLIRLNTPLAAELGLNLPENDAELAALFAGNTLFAGSDPIAQAYAGHQFGHFVPQLGDGRAVLLGEVVNDTGTRFDIQLKGSGQTPFSRNGDGRSPLGPVLREYIVSEAMHALGIPTSRSLAMVSTGEEVRRETVLPGAVLTRVAASHVRVGTFEYFAARKNTAAVIQLADYAIDRHYPHCREAANPYAALFEAVCHAQARLVAGWMTIGFIHGVMNTDNTTISGETIDFGPCAFMDSYNPEAVFSSIDHQGRYAYNNQPTIAQWNMACFGGCLVPLLHPEEDAAHEKGQAILDSFTPVFKEAYQGAMCRKIGLRTHGDHDFDLVRGLLTLMHRDHVDFTNVFRLLGTSDTAFAALFSSGDTVREWLKAWQARLTELGTDLEDARQTMHHVNPAFIPRNHRVEEAIRAAEDHGDYGPTHRLIEVLTAPYADQPENAAYMAPPKPDEMVHQTFCGT